jgi:hypothetical protein
MPQPTVTNESCDTLQVDNVIALDFHLRIPDLPAVERQHRPARAPMDHSTQRPIKSSVDFANRTTTRDKAPAIEAQHKAFHSAPSQCLTEPHSVNSPAPGKHFG